MKQGRTYPLTIPDLLNNALDKLAASDLIEAYQNVDQACRLGDTHALLLRATILFRRGFLGDAIEDLQTALLLKPGNQAITYSLINMCLSDLESYREIFRQTLSSLVRYTPELSLDSEVSAWLAAGDWSAMGAAWQDGDYIVGWAINAHDVHATLSIELDERFLSTATGLPTPWLLEAGVGNGYNGFRLKLPATFTLLRLGISGASLWGSPFIGSTGRLDIDVSSALPILPIVDIIVPVYSGYKETLECLDSIKAARNMTPYRLIVVDDCSPDEKLRLNLRERAERSEITLISRPINAGFSGAVNAGLMFDNSRDVILLNADTVVFGNWLDRLRSMAYRQGDIATVTPFSNHGELLSYPIPMRDNPLVNIQHAEQIDALFNKLGSDEPVDIPVGVGFCLYVKRQALNAVGLFDEKNFGRGYGEDTDFFIRIKAQGWRNVCATNTYVVHWGSRSFGAEKKQLVAKNIPFLLAKYPKHSEEYQHFLDVDPNLQLRRTIQRQWLAAILPEYQVVLSVGAAAQDEGVSFTLLLDTDKSNQWRLNLVVVGLTGLDTISYQWPSQFGELREDMLAAEFSSLSFKTFGSWPAEIIDQLCDGFIPYNFQLVDYSAYCPRKYRLNCDANSCNDPVDVSVCTQCVAQLGPLVYDYSGIDSWRARAQRIFSHAIEISAESEEILAAFLRRFPELQAKMSRSNLCADVPEMFQLPKEFKETLRIAVLSAGSLDEGYFQLLEQVKWSENHNRSLDFIVFGRTMNDLRLRQLANVYLAGEMPADRLPDMLRLHACSAIANFSPFAQHRVDVARFAVREGFPLIQNCKNL